MSAGRAGGSDGGPIVVIGAGLGGLAAAVRLRCAGHDVQVVEARDEAGGRARVIHRDGFTFDTGPTVITAPWLIEELFARAGRRLRDYVNLVPVDPFYRVLLADGSQFDYVGDEERILAQIRTFNPADVDGYRRLVVRAREIFEVGFVRYGDRPFQSPMDMVRIAPDLVRLGCLQSVYTLVSHYIRDERLRQVFTFQPLLVGGNPFRVSAIYTLIHWIERTWGVHHVVGGTGQLVAALVTLLGELGVEIRTRTPVERIELADGHVAAVHTEAGERIPAGRIVANADPAFVYRQMLSPRASPRNAVRARLLRPSMGVFLGFWGADRQWPALAQHTILLGPRYRGLLEDIFDKKRLADDFSLYLHAPCRTDPSVAPAGCDGGYVLAPVPNNRSGIDWAQEGERYFDRILDHLDRTVMPGLGSSLTTRFHLDPRYHETALRSVDGAAFGPEPRLEQSAWFRYHNRSEDIGGLYFVGAGTHPGAGVPGVLSSARALDRLIPPSAVRRVTPEARAAK